VLSNSWGGGGFSQALLDAINRASANDILFVAAAGNNASNNDVTPNFPSSYNAPNVVAVAATDHNDALAAFSNFGATSVHLGAPGVAILSTTRNNAYSVFNGTSMATPHVSGAAALILSTSALTTAQLKSQILSNVDPIPSLSGITSTGGRLNLCKAIPGCGGSPDFSLAISPDPASATPGASVSYTVDITPTGGFGGEVSFEVSDLPVDATGTFDPNPATGSSVLTVATSTTTPEGSAVFTVTGRSGALTHTATATLIVSMAEVSTGLEQEIRLVPGRPAAHGGPAPREPRPATAPASGSNWSHDYRVSAGAAGRVEPRSGEVRPLRPIGPIR
jgi:subtilisin family serine protease